MTLAEFLIATYGWADARAWPILAGAVLVPALGTLVAWVGKGGRTDRDGRAAASALVGFGLVVFVLALLGITIAHLVFERSLVDANLVLIAAPVVCLAGCLVGIRAVFPLDELASVQSVVDIGGFVAACLGVLWLFSKFRGWGIVFFGSIGELIVVGVLGYLLLRRLYRRAFGRRR